jgi:type I restriction modification DNA specificity family protein
MKKYKLGDIAILNASIIDKKKNIEIEYLDTSSILEGHILGTQKIYLSEAPSRAQRKVKNKTIIYSLVRPNQNHYGILYNTPDNFIVSTGFATIDLKEEFKETIDADFLFLLLTQKQITHYLHRIAENSASAYPSLIPSDIAKLELNFPSIKKQKNIARLIQNINEKIELNRSINHNLEAMAKQLYDYWFMQFDFPDENGKPYKSSGGKMVWNKKLKREIPEGWEVDNICKIAHILSGGTPSKTVFRYWKNGIIPFFSPTDCNGNIFQIETADHITQEGLEHCASSLFDEGTIFITARGSIGKLVIVGSPMAMNQSCYALLSKKDEYQYLYFLTFQLIECLKIKGSGSVFKSITISDIEKSLLCIANNEIITAFCKLVSPSLQKIKKNLIEIKQLTKLRDSLLPLLMNGQASLQNCD